MQVNLRLVLRPLQSSGLSLLVVLLVVQSDGGESGNQIHNPRVGHDASSSQTIAPPRKNTIPPIVFVSRNRVQGSDVSDAIPGMGPRHRTSIVGGRLMSMRRDGSVRVLVDSTVLFDVADPCVSWDARTIVFSGAQHPDSSWRIYQINSDGSGFMQLTLTDRVVDISQFGSEASHFLHYDDIDPCYLPDGRIVFASTRYPLMSLLDSVRVTNLYVMEYDGKGMHRITSERNGGEEPTIDPVTGKIVYARWWLNVDMPSNKTVSGLTRDVHDALTNDIANIWQAIIINPDGNELKLYAGFPRTRLGTQTYKPAVMDNGTLLSVFSPHTSLTKSIGGTGIRWFKAGADFEHHVIGIKPDDVSTSVSPAAPPYATDPVQLDTKTILFSYSSEGSDYGIYSCRLNGSGLIKIIDLPGTLELEPQILASRRVPPIVKDQFPPLLIDLPPTLDSASHYKNDLFRFDCMNIFTNGDVDEPIPDAPRIATDATIRFFISVQGDDPLAGAAVLLKEAPVFRSGGVHQPELPADVPLFEQVVDSLGRVLESPGGKFAHVPGMNFERIGGGTKCVGCHAGHSIITVPINGSLAEWFNVSTSATVTGSSFWKDSKVGSCDPMRVVDRQARTGGDTVNWVSTEGAGAFVQMSWEIPIEVREFRLFNIEPDLEKGTTIRVKEAEILLYLNHEIVGQVRSTGTLSSRGTRISISRTKIDAAKIIIKKFTGTFHHRPFAGFAEIETIARIPTN